MSFKLPEAGRRGHQSAFKTIRTQNKLDAHSQYVFTSFDPSIFQFNHSASVTICFSGVKLNALIDSGSSVSLVTEGIVQQIGCSIDNGHQKNLISASGDSLMVTGKINLPLTVGSLNIEHAFVYKCMLNQRQLQLSLI